MSFVITCILYYVKSMKNNNFAIKLIVRVPLKYHGIFFLFRYGIRYFCHVSWFRIRVCATERSRFRAVDIDLRTHRADLIGYARRICALPTADNGRWENVRARRPSKEFRVKELKRAL